MLSVNSGPSSPGPEPARPADLSALIALEVGDEVFIIEQQKSWYRGYVLRAMSRGLVPNTAPIGCFPKNHVHVKGYLRSNLVPANHRYSVAIDPMDTLTVPEWDLSLPLSAKRSSILSTIVKSPRLPRSLSDSNITKPDKLNLNLDPHNAEDWSANSRPESTTEPPYTTEASTLSSLDLAERSQAPSQQPEPHRLPPLPFTRFSQSTATGESEPLIDEIAACIREWHCRLYTHLSERHYGAFNAVKDHINYLFQARRQLLDKTLSRDELSRLRKELIHRMVIVNMLQGGEMLVRHPNLGHLLDLQNTSIATIYRMHFEYANKELTPLHLHNASSNSSILSSSSPTVPSPSMPSSMFPNSSSGLAELAENMHTASPNVPHPPSPLIMNTPTTNAAKGAKFYHLYFDLKACVAHICQPGEFTELYFSLYNHADNKFLTEEYLVVLNYNGMPKDEGRIGKLNTLFTQISNHDLNKDIYLVCRIVRMGSMKLSDKDHVSSLSGGQASIVSGSTDSKSYFDLANGKQHQISLQHQLAQQRQLSYTSPSQQNQASSHGFRRPFGCAVLHLGGLLQGSANSQTLSSASPAPAFSNPNILSSSMVSTPSNVGTPVAASLNARSNIASSAGRDMLAAEHFMPIYTPTSESGFSTLVRNIIDETPKEYERNPRAEMLCVYLRLFHGELDNVVKTNTGLLQDVPMTSWLGFPDVVFPGDFRNELYITLSSGDFTQFGRSKNLQVTLCVRDNTTGDVIENSLCPGSGVMPTTYWESMIFYHEQRPSWEETIKVKISDVTKWENAHVYMTIRHRSSTSYHPTQGSPPHRGSNSPSQGLPSEKIIAFGFLPLFLPPLLQNFVVDGTHKIALYRYDKQMSSPHVYLKNAAWCLNSTAPANTISSNNLASVKQSHRHTFGHGHHSSISSKNALAIIPNGSSNSISSLGRQQDGSSSSGTVTPTQTAPTPTLKPAQLRETVNCRTFLCSTQYTQNQILVQLLNWQAFLEDGAEGKKELQSVLDQFTFVGEMEVVKFLGDIFDALFGILTYNRLKDETVTALDDQVVDGIVWVLGIIQDRRFSNFRPVLDVYIEQLFAQSGTHTPRNKAAESLPKEAYVYDALLKSHLRLCSDPSDMIRAKKLRSSMKVWEYLFRFIVRSREVARHNEEESERQLRDMMFKEEIQQLMKLINGIMSPELPSSMIGSQTLALQHFASILGELRRVFSPTEVADIIIAFLDASIHFTGKLVAHRLCTIISVIKSPIFTDMESKSTLVPKVVGWVAGWINSYSQVAEEQDSAAGKETNIPPTQSTNTLPRAQWLENLRLSITIVYLVFEKVRGFRSMSHTSTSLSSSWVSSMFSMKNVSNIRPISLATHDEYDESQDDIGMSEHEDIEITTVLLSMLPRMLSTFRELQQIVSLSYKAMLQSNTSSLSNSTSTPSASSNKPPPIQTRTSVNTLRDRAPSVSSKAPSASGSNSSNSQSINNQNVLSKCPAIPFPTTYPFSSSPMVKPNTKSSALDLTPLVSSGLLDLSIIILELFNVTPAHELKEYLINMIEEQGARRTSMIIREICRVCLAILLGEGLTNDCDDEVLQGLDPSVFKKIAAARCIPRNWLNLQMVAHQVVITSILVPISELIDEDYFPLEPKANSQFELDLGNNTTIDLWQTLLRTALSVVSSPELEISRFLPQRQHAMWKLIGDLRGSGGLQVMMTLWKAFHLEQQPPDVMQDLGEEATVDPSFKMDEAMETVQDATNDIAPDAENSTPRASLISPLSNKQSDALASTVMGSSKLELFYTNILPVIVRPLCSLGLSNHDQVRQTAATMLIDLFSVEYKRLGSITRLQQYLVGTMDRLLMVENKGNDNTRHQLISDLQTTLEQQCDLVRGEYYQLVEDAISSLSTFLDLLLQIRSLPQDDEYKDERINATLKLMHFIQMIEREVTYTKYVHQMVHLQLESHNFIEAALTLKLHADLLEWDPYGELSAISELNFPAQTTFARKEKIYYKMLDYLERGKAWEICIQICKELAQQYETTTFDYIKLSEITIKQAGFVESIAKKERYFPEYFRVGFYGRGFPTTVRNQQFVFRGLEWEKIASFIERIQNKHPNAEILPPKIASGSSISEKDLKELEQSPDGQYLQITAVTPEPEKENRPVFNNELVTDNIRSYYIANEVYMFSFSRPVIKPSAQNEDGTNKPDNEFLNLWTEKTTLICDDTFPTILRRSRVIKTKVVELSPIENAVYAMEQKNNEFEVMERKYNAILAKLPKNQVGPPSININPFSMALNGAVDAPVNGGVPMYKAAFLTPEFAKQHPDMLGWVDRLRAAIDKQVEIIEECLELHNKLVPFEMRPLHNNLIKFFRKNFREEIQRVNVKRNKSQAARRQSRASQVLSATSLQDIIDRTDSTRQGSISAAGSGLGKSMPPISRAFSIRPSSMILTGIEDDLEQFDDDTAGKRLPSADVSSKAESISRSFKMSLRMKSGRRRTSSNPDVFDEGTSNISARGLKNGNLKQTGVSSPSLTAEPRSSTKAPKKRTWAFSRPRSNS